MTNAVHVPCAEGLGWLADHYIGGLRYHSIHRYLGRLLLNRGGCRTYTRAPDCTHTSYSNKSFSSNICVLKALLQTSGNLVWR